MEIDFHFGVTYVVGRLAGLKHDQAEIVATASQYVDDTVNEGVLQFKTGQAYYRTCTAHKVNDYKLYRHVDELLVWVPFHFLPGNVSCGSLADEYQNRVVCRARGDIAREMVRSCILGQDLPFALHRLGITAHVLADTWAHQGFAGIKHRVNLASKIRLEEPNDDPDWRGLRENIRPYVCDIVNRCFPMGHGSVLHYPDHPFRKWSYVNGHGERIERDNRSEFLEAADELCKLFRRFLIKDPDANVEGLLDGDKVKIAAKLTNLTDDDGHARNKKWLDAIGNNEFSFGSAEPSYVDSGRGSWKYQAIGTERAEIDRNEEFDYRPEFLHSDWKLFHDAAQVHRFVVLREILPRFRTVHCLMWLPCCPASTKV